MLPDLTPDAFAAFVRAHEAYAMPAVFAVSMAESIVVLSLLAPSTIILLAAAATLGAGGLEILPLWLAAGVGAAIGDWISYGMGRASGKGLRRRWPFRKNKRMLARGQLFFVRWGWAGIFLSRFVGPLRSLTPLAAGVYKMPMVVFGAASAVSALLWAGVVLAPAWLGASWLSREGWLFGAS